MKGLILVRVTLYKLTCCLPSLKQLVFQLTANKGSIAICPSTPIPQPVINYVYSTNGVSFFKKVARDFLKCPSLIVIQGSAFPGFDLFRGKQRLRSASIHKCLSIEGKQALIGRSLNVRP